MKKCMTSCVLETVKEYGGKAFVKIWTAVQASNLILGESARARTIKMVHKRISGNLLHVQR